MGKLSTRIDVLNLHSIRDHCSSSRYTAHKLYCKKVVCLGSGMVETKRVQLHVV